jgi:hypothetical protein
MNCSTRRGACRRPTSRGCRRLTQLERLEGKVMSRFVAAGVNNQGLAGPDWADLSV